MNPKDLEKARWFAFCYRLARGAHAKLWHREVYAYVPELAGTAPEVWLTTVMQLAKS